MEKQPLVLKFKNKEAEYSFENKINIVQEKEFLNILSRPNYKNQNSSLVIKSMNDLAIADVIQIKVNISSVGSLFTNFNKEDKAVLEAAGLEVEPDFYHQAREKFRILHIIIAYLVFFTVVWFHLRHGFAAVFQTFGLYNYKYGKAIEVLGQIYTWVVCLMFAVVVIGVYFGL